MADNKPRPKPRQASGQTTQPHTTAKESNKVPFLPKLVNRGAAGLLKRVDGASKERQVATSTKGINNISQDLRDKGMVVPIDSIQFDPNNARVHPENNIDDIKQSLKQFGQVKPIAVRKETMTVLAGNGTLEAAMSLGWTEIAITIISMSDGYAAGYAVADNRCGESSLWDWTTLAMLESIARKEAVPLVGWTTAEVMALRKEYGPQQEKPEQAGEDQSGELEAKYHVMVDCKTEVEQLEVIRALRKMKIKCKALVF